jgi:hypothetical protein
MQGLLTKFPSNNKFGWDTGMGGPTVAALQV